MSVNIKFYVFAVLANNQCHCKISWIHYIFCKNSNIVSATIILIVRRFIMGNRGNKKDLSLRSDHSYIYVYSRFLHRKCIFSVVREVYCKHDSKIWVCIQQPTCNFRCESMVITLPKKEGLPFLVHISRDVYPCFLADRQAQWTWMWWDHSTTPSNVEFTQTELSESHFSSVNERCTDCWMGNFDDNFRPVWSKFDLVNDQ